MSSERATEGIMFGSRRESNLMDGRKVVWNHGTTTGIPLNEFLPTLVEFAANYPGNKSDLMIGYWEYGDEIVVTASESR